MPGAELETVVVQWRPTGSSASATAAALRDTDVPVICRIHDDAICFDLRTIREPDVEALVASVASTVWEADSKPRASALANTHPGPTLHQLQMTNYELQKKKQDPA